MFFNPIFIMLIISGIALIHAGNILSKRPPKKINWLYGYRTKNSMKSQERWDFAQKNAAKLMKQYGKYLMFPTLLGFFFTDKEEHMIYSIIIVCFLILLIISIIIIRVESALKKRFGKNN